MLHALNEHRSLFVTSLLLTGMGAVLEGVSIGLLVPFLDGLLSPDAAPFQVGVAWLDRWVLAAHKAPLDRLYHISVLLLGTVWIRAMVGYGAALCSEHLTEQIGDSFRQQIMDQVQRVSLRFFSKLHSGEILNVLLQETFRLTYLLGIYRTMLINGTLLLAYGVAIVAISWKLSLFALCFCALLMGALTTFLRRLKKNGDAVSASNSRISAVGAELIAGIRTVAEFGTQTREQERFRQASQAHRSTVLKAKVKAALVQPLSSGIASTALIVMVVIAVQFFVLEGVMSSGALVAFLVALLRLLPNLQTINNSRAEWSVFSGSVNTVAEFLRRDNKPYLQDGTMPFPRFHEAIELRRVRFEYEPGRPVLKNIDIKIPFGQVTAIVGASGSGKSTLVDLVARFYDVTEGQILLDGVDIRRYKIKDLRRRIAVVNQHTFLFNDTVRANICYGLSDIPEERVIEAARKANALEFIEEMPQGFDTVLGERGTRLSGGQRQRIAIARALLRDPEILILDEATSALDTVSERLIQESLEYLMRGRTVIVIAHRLSTIENADRILVLEGGRLVEEGTFDSLIEQHGQFWHYHSLQFHTAS